MMRTLGRMLRTPLGATALVLLAVVVVTAVVAPVLWGAQADVKDTGDLLAGPSAEHLIGTDNLGRDLLRMSPRLPSWIRSRNSIPRPV